MLCLYHFVSCKIGWDGLTALSSTALAATAIIAALYTRDQIKDFQREAKIKHLIDLVDQFEREPLATLRRQLGRLRTHDGQLNPLDPDAPPDELHDILNFFEHVGYLLDGGYLDIVGVSVEFHFWIFHVWADAASLVQHEQSESPVYYEYVTKMVSRLVELERKRFPGFTFPTVADIVDFYEGEAHLATHSPIPRQKRKRKMTQ
jgi:hypothetical protein